MSPYLEGHVNTTQMCTGLGPELLARPALIFSSEPSSAALVPTSRSKGPNCNQGSEELKTTYDLPSHLTLHRGVSLLSSRCIVIMPRSVISWAEDTWSSKILLQVKQIPCEKLSQILLAVKVDNHGWYRCTTPHQGPTRYDPALL